MKITCPTDAFGFLGPGNDVVVLTNASDKEVWLKWNEAPGQLTESGNDVIVTVAPDNEPSFTIYLGDSGDQAIQPGCRLIIRKAFKTGLYTPMVTPTANDSIMGLQVMEVLNSTVMRELLYAQNSALLVSLGLTSVDNIIDGAAVKVNGFTPDAKADLNKAGSARTVNEIS